MNCRRNIDGCRRKRSLQFKCGRRNTWWVNVRQYVWHVGYYFEFNVSLTSFSTVSKNRVCIPPKTTQPDTDTAYIRYYYGIVRKSVLKNYMNLTCVQNLLSTWFALSVDDSCDWLSATTTLPMGQILLKSFSHYRRFFMRWTLFWDVVKLFPPYSL